MKEEEVEREVKKMNEKGIQGKDYPFLCIWDKCNAEIWHGEHIHSIFNYEIKDFDYYCEKHYNVALEKKFLKLYNEWDGKKVTSEFRNIFAIYAEHLYPGHLPGALSKGKIEDRTFMKKYRYGVEFWITRHKNAFKNPEKMYKVDQCWRFYIKSKKLKLWKEI